MATTPGFRPAGLPRRRWPWARCHVPIGGANAGALTAFDVLWQCPRDAGAHGGIDQLRLRLPELRPRHAPLRGRSLTGRSDQSSTLNDSKKRSASVESVISRLSALTPRWYTRLPTRQVLAR